MRAQQLSEKQVLQTEKSCRLRSVGLCGSEAGRPGKEPISKCYSDDFLHGKRIAAEHFPTALDAFSPWRPAHPVISK